MQWILFLKRIECDKLVSHQTKKNNHHVSFNTMACFPFMGEFIVNRNGTTTIEICVSHPFHVICISTWVGNRMHIVHIHVTCISNRWIAFDKHLVCFHLPVNGFQNDIHWFVDLLLFGFQFWFRIHKCFAFMDLFRSTIVRFIHLTVLNGRTAIVFIAKNFTSSHISTTFTVPTLSAFR